MKPRLAGKAKRLNVEHRTSNIECRILMALRFIESKTSESQNLEGRFSFTQSLFKLTEYIIGCWTFDVRRLFFSKPLILNYIAKVSFSIRLAVFLAGGWADT